MELAQSKPHRLRFDEFILDKRRRGLYRGDERVRLTAKPLEALIFLVENSGRIVEKQELLDAVWKDTFVTEDVLVHAIRDIRRALGDNKENPRFIQTVPRQGYRFLCELLPEIALEERITADLIPAQISLSRLTETSSQIIPSGEISPDSPPITLLSITKPERKPLNKKRIAIMALATLSIIALIPALKILIPWLFPPPPPIPNPVLTPITFEIGSVGKPAFSSDGNITYIYGSDIWVRDPRSNVPTEITKEAHPSGDMPVFNADGNKVFFSIPSKGDDGSRLYDLYEAGSSGGPRQIFIKEASGAGFSPDNKWVAYTKYIESRKVLRICPLDNPESYVAEIENGFVPRWSPDGKYIAYTTADPNANDGYLFIESVSTSTSGELLLSNRKQLTKEKSDMYGIAWTPDNRSIIIAARDNLTLGRKGPFHLYRISIADACIKALTQAGESNYLCPSVSSDGKTLFFWYGKFTNSLMVSDRIESTEQEAVIEGELHKYPRLSPPSGDKLLTASQRVGFDENLYIIDLTRTPKQRSSLGNLVARHPIWINESQIAYLQNDGSGNTVVRIITSNASIHPISLSEFQGTANWLAIYNKKMIAVVLTSSDGRQQIVLRNLDTKQNTTIAEGGEYEYLRWTPDGSALLWSSPRISSDSANNGIWKFDLNESRTQRLFKDGYAPIWRADGKGFYFARIREYSGLWRFDFQNNKETQVRHWEFHHEYRFDIVGKRIVFTQPSGGGQVYSMPLEQ